MSIYIKEDCNKIIKLTAVCYALLIVSACAEINTSQLKCIIMSSCTNNVEQTLSFRD